MMIFAIVIGQVARIHTQWVKTKRYFEIIVVVVMEVNIRIDGTEIGKCSDY